MSIGKTKVSEIMTRDVVCVSPYTTLGELLKLFKTSNLRVFPVVDEREKLIGLISIKHVYKIFESYGKTVARYFGIVESFVDKEILPPNIFEVDTPVELSILIDVEDMMDFSPPAIKHTKTLEDAYELMKKKDLQVLPVVNEGKLVGIISLFDIIYFILKQRGMIPH